MTVDSRQLRAPSGAPGRRLDPTGQLLLAVLAGGAVDPAAIRAASGPLVDWALEQRVPGLFHAAVGGQLDEPAASRLGERVLLDAGHHLRTLFALGRLAEALQARNLSWVAVKGPVLVETAYSPISRPYLDLDLLVSPSRFRPALEALEAAGSILIDRNWELLIREGRAQVGLKDGSTGLTVDLHWHLVNLARMRRTFSLRTDEMLERRVTLPLPSSMTPALERTDRFVHYALHAATSGGHRLVWLADLSRVMANDPPDWDELVRRCRRWKVGLPVAVMLARVEATLGSPVPDGVVECLVGGAGRWLTEWLSVWEPSGRLPGGGSLRHGVTGSLAGSPGETAQLTAVKAAEMVRRAWDRYPHWLDPNDPAHIEHDAGGAPGRERYLALVAGQA